MMVKLLTLVSSGYLIVDHCWDSVSLAIADYAYCFESLPRAVRRRR